LANIGNPFYDRVPTEPSRQIAALGDLEGGEPGARYAGSAGILPAWGRHGGSNRQGELLKPRHFAENSRLEGGAPRGRSP